MTLCVVNAMNENGMILLLSLGHHHQCHLSLTTCNNSDWGVDHLQSLLSLSSAASGSRVTVEQDTHMEHTQHTCQLNQHTCQLAKHDFNFCNLRFWIFSFWFSIFTKRDFNFLIFNFWIFNFQLFQNATSTFYVSTF